MLKLVAYAENIIIIFLSQNEATMQSPNLDIEIYQYQILISDEMLRKCKVITFDSRKIKELAVGALSNNEILYLIQNMDEKNVRIIIKRLYKIGRLKNKIAKNHPVDDVKAIIISTLDDALDPTDMLDEIKHQICDSVSDGYIENKLQDMSPEQIEELEQALQQALPESYVCKIKYQKKRFFNEHTAELIGNFIGNVLFRLTQSVPNSALTPEQMQVNNHNDRMRLLKNSNRFGDNGFCITSPDQHWAVPIPKKYLLDFRINNLGEYNQLCSHYDRLTYFGNDAALFPYLNTPDTQPVSGQLLSFLKDTVLASDSNREPTFAMLKDHWNEYYIISLESPETIQIRGGISSGLFVPSQKAAEKLYTAIQKGKVLLLPEQNKLGNSDGQYYRNPIFSYFSNAKPVNSQTTPNLDTSIMSYDADAPVYGENHLIRIIQKPMSLEHLQKSAQELIANNKSPTHYVLYITYSGLFYINNNTKYSIGVRLLPDVIQELETAIQAYGMKNKHKPQIDLNHDAFIAILKKGKFDALILWLKEPIQLRDLETDKLMIEVLQSKLNEYQTTIINISPESELGEIIAPFIKQLEQYSFNAKFTEEHAIIFNCIFYEKLHLIINHVDKFQIAAQNNYEFVREQVNTLTMFLEQSDQLKNILDYKQHLLSESKAKITSENNKCKI